MQSLSRSPSVVMIALFLVCTACDRSSPTSSEEGPPGLSLAAQEDVEALIGGSMAGWWRAVHGFGPALTLSVAADAQSSSWRNWGMLHAGQEPRQELSGVEERFREYVSDRPWIELYRTLVSVRDGMLALADGQQLGDAAATHRALAFGSFMQGLALGTLAQLFDQAWILDESVDPSSVELAAYPDVMAAALDKLDRAIELAEEEEFTIPAEWVGFQRTLDQEGFTRLARSWRARLRISVARTPADRAAVDWTAALEDARNGIEQDWGGAYDGSYEVNWAWQATKLIGSHPAWIRVDYRTIGPADASGSWEEWIGQSPQDRRPFPIDTDDTRITGGSPTDDGSYFGYEDHILFRPERGMDHFSFYTNIRWGDLWERQGVAFYVDFPVKELDFIEAEALFRLGDRAGATTIVNRWRANGNLPPFTNPAGRAPEGDRCVPRRPDGSCGDLWDALRYEKRIETLNHGPFTEYLDARGWGELVEGTFRNLLRPDVTLPELLMELYDAGSETEAAQLANTSTAEDLDRKRQAVGRFDRARNVNPGNVGAG